MQLLHSPSLGPRSRGAVRANGILFGASGVAVYCINSVYTVAMSTAKFRRRRACASAAYPGPARRNTARAPCVRLRVSGNDRFSCTPRIPPECTRYAGREEERRLGDQPLFSQHTKRISRNYADSRQQIETGGWKFNTLSTFITSPNLLPYNACRSTVLSRCLLRRGNNRGRAIGEGSRKGETWLSSSRGASILAFNVRVLTRWLLKPWKLGQTYRTISISSNFFFFVKRVFLGLSLCSFGRGQLVLPLFPAIPTSRDQFDPLVVTFLTAIIRFLLFVNIR